MGARDTITLGADAQTQREQLLDDSAATQKLAGKSRTLLPVRQRLSGTVGLLPRFSGATLTQCLSGIPFRP